MLNTYLDFTPIVFFAIKRPVVVYSSRGSNSIFRIPHDTKVPLPVRWHIYGAPDGPFQSHDWHECFSNAQLTNIGDWRGFIVSSWACSFAPRLASLMAWCVTDKGWAWNWPLFGEIFSIQWGKPQIVLLWWPTCNSICEITCHDYIESQQIYDVERTVQQFSTIFFFNMFMELFT